MSLIKYYGILQNAKATRKPKGGIKLPPSSELVTQIRIKELASLSAVKGFLNQRVTCLWILVNIIFKEVYNMT